MNRPLPHDTATAATAEAIRVCRNLGLLLDRFGPWGERTWTESGEQKKAWDLWMKINDRGTRSFARSSEAKGIWLRGSQSNAVSLPLFPSTHLDGDLIERATARWASLVRSHAAEPFTVEVDYRLVVGFGAEHVLETNLCLHRIYGFPIIPGSAVKGVTRAWAFWEMVEKFSVPESSLKALDKLLAEGEDFTRWRAEAATFYAVFGTTEEKGQVIFFDAYPTDSGRLKLELDILNPHYGKYYQGDAPPADYLTPVPTYFLTVAKGSLFQFAVASKNPDLAAQAKEWLTCALKELGIGGKTAAGYGFMEVR